MDTEELQPTPTRQKLVYKDLFKDRLFISLIITGFVATAVIVTRVMLSVSQYDIDIPIRYTQFGGIDSYITGDWYSHYNFAIFAVIMTFINTLIALRIYRHRRHVSISILTLQLFIFVFLFVISGAIIDTLPVAA